MRTQDSQGGFVIVAALLLITVMLSIGLTYVRHTSLNTPSSMAYEDSLSARESVESGVEYAREALEAEKHVVGKTLHLGETDVQLDTTDASDSSRRLELASTNSAGLGSTLLVELGQIKPGGDLKVAHPDELPTVKPATMTQLMADTSIPKITISGQQTYENTTLEGIVILEKACFALLKNVVVKGLIVSRAVVDGGPVGEIDWSQTPCLVVDNNFRIDPGSFLDDVAIVMPDGVFRTWQNDGSFQVRGDVSVHTVLMERPGVFDGGLAYVDLTLTSKVERIGHGLAPLQLSSEMTPGLGLTDSFLAVIPRAQKADDLSVIRDYWMPDEP